MDTILAADPGISTGWVIGQIEGQDIDIVEFGQFKDDSHVSTARTLKELAGDHKATTVILEQFDLRPHNQFVANLQPVKVNAILDATLDTPIRYQTPSQVKTLITDVRLKRLGFWPTGRHVQQPDANDVRDAARHLYYHAIRTLRLTDTARRMTTG